jgi:hypothetical protein
VVCIHHGFFISPRSLSSRQGRKRRGKEEAAMKILFIATMAATFVLGMGFLSLMFVFGSLVFAEAQGC